jgi:N-acetylated-alpha-linked acidic dipeptidase
MREETAGTNRLVEDGSYKIALDSTKSLGPPVQREEVPHFNFAPLKNALSRLKKAAGLVNEMPDVGELSNTQLAELNRGLYTSERRLTRQEGLAGRSWYKHHIYAPGFYTGYGVKTIPGVREAIEIRQFDQVPEQISIAAGVLDALSAQLEELAGR